MKLNEMTDSEKQTLGALVRVMVGADREYSPAESAQLEQAAAELGEDEFWQLVGEAGKRDLTEDVVKPLALAVERPEVRETIYGVLFDLAAAGSIVGQEGTLLDWLANAWNLETASPPPQEDV